MEMVNDVGDSYNYKRNTLYALSHYNLIQIAITFILGDVNIQASLQAGPK